MHWKAPIDFDNVDFVELYDIQRDPWQMQSLGTRSMQDSA